MRQNNQYLKRILQNMEIETKLFARAQLIFVSDKEGRTGTELHFPLRLL